MKQRRQQGFTLIELLVVVVIVAILASIATPQYFKVVEKARIVEVNALMSAVRLAQEELLVKNGSYAKTNLQLQRSLITLPGEDPTYGMRYYFLIIGPGSPNGCDTYGQYYNVQVIRYGKSAKVVPRYYKNYMVALNNNALQMGGEIHAERAGKSTKALTDIEVRPVYQDGKGYYNPVGGIGTFLMPPILILILQQTLIMGICMLAAVERAWSRSTGGSAASGNGSGSGAPGKSGASGHSSGSRVSHASTLAKTWAASSAGVFAWRLMFRPFAERSRSHSGLDQHVRTRSLGLPRGQLSASGTDRRGILRPSSTATGHPQPRKSGMRS